MEHYVKKPGVTKDSEDSAMGMKGGKQETGAPGIGHPGPPYEAQTTLHTLKRIKNYPLTLQLSFPHSPGQAIRQVLLMSLPHNTCQTPSHFHVFCSLSSLPGIPSYWMHPEHPAPHTFHP